MTESRWQRWSRKKADASRQAGPSPALPLENEPSAEDKELAVNQSLPEHEVLEKYGLPNPDAITLGTDITGFMRKEIPELLRRKALRALWKSNPVLAVLDGLNDYDEDYTDAATAGEAVKTLYRVGQGMFDKSAKEVGQTKQLTNPPDSQPEQAKPLESSASEAPSLPDHANEPERQIRQPPPQPNAQTDWQENDTEPAPSYRPRMRFD